MTIKKKVLQYVGMFFLGGAAVSILSIVGDRVSNAAVGSVVGGIPLLTSIMLWRAWLTNHKSRLATTTYARPFNLAVLAAVCATIYISFACCFLFPFRFFHSNDLLGPFKKWAFIPCWSVALLLWFGLMGCVYFLLIPFLKRNNILMEEALS